MAELDLDTRQEGALTFVDLTGDFDADNASRVQESLTALMDRDNPLVLIRMEGLKYIDSAGLGVLVGTLKQAAARGGQMVLVAPSPFVTRILRVTALDKVFAVFPDEAQARAGLSSTRNAFSG